MPQLNKVVSSPLSGSLARSARHTALRSSAGVEVSAGGFSCTGGEPTGGVKLDVKAGIAPGATSVEWSVNPLDGGPRMTLYTEIKVSWDADIQLPGYLKRCESTFDGLTEAVGSVLAGVTKVPIYAGFDWTTAIETGPSGVAYRGSGTTTLKVGMDYRPGFPGGSVRIARNDVDTRSASGIGKISNKVRWRIGVGKPDTIAAAADLSQGLGTSLTLGADKTQVCSLSRLETEGVTAALHFKAGILDVSPRYTIGDDASVPLGEAACSKLQTSDSPTPAPPDPPGPTPTPTPIFPELPGTPPPGTVRLVTPESVPRGFMPVIRTSTCDSPAGQPAWINTQVPYGASGSYTDSRNSPHVSSTYLHLPVPQRPGPAPTVFWFSGPATYSIRCVYGSLDSPSVVWATSVTVTFDGGQRRITFSADTAQPGDTLRLRSVTPSDAPALCPVVGNMAAREFEAGVVVYPADPPGSDGISQAIAHIEPPTADDQLIDVPWAVTKATPTGRASTSARCGYAVTDPVTGWTDVTFTSLLFENDYAEIRSAP
ncbi:MAG: hypothetical protein M3370_00340 [Actinomycetota bacterium]|nr:hypothetical protein [Actinomycetota bacterium]